ncbi:serine hydrolase domain-containing protein [Streptomyces sp. NPDC057702]|uniref:serine hydrolase domain-containing protein n=1 Tax=unclassified Streptomyces TaxID=2593676 RepID=UPI00369A3A85
MTDPGRTTLGDLDLFTGAPQHERFSRLQRLLPTSELTPSTRPYSWPRGEALTLPETFAYDGVERSLEEFLTDTDTAALLVVVDGAIRHERYALTGGADAQWLSMSVAKSYVSALVGIAIAEGHIGAVDDPVSSYVPVPAGSAYDGISIRDVLQMSSGARWNEDYNDPASDFNRLTRATLAEFAAGLEPESAPGTVCRYNSAETQVLGALLARATGRSLTAYTQEKLCEPLGMEAPGYWLVDPEGTELAYAGLNLTARDYAKFGELYRNDGVWQGRQIVPRQWVRDSVTVAADHLKTGGPIIGGHHVDVGYGYQWWLPDGDEGEFTAIGVYNQFVYVAPAHRVTIVKLSANRRYGTTTGEASNRELETLALLRAVTRHAHAEHTG